MYRTKKPKLSTKEQIEHLEKKGVKFVLISREEATDYLTKHNNYFKLTAYRKNFQKHPAGKFKGQYIGLDFQMLKDLAIIDMRLRQTLLHMALDIEHFAKVELLKVIENSDIDAYDLVEDYIKSLDEVRLKILNDELNRNMNNPYCGDIIAKYKDNYPIWAFMEVIPFGRFINVYRFCAETINDKKLRDNYFLLLSIKDLRNATAHNNCLINNLSPRTSNHRTNYGLIHELSKIGISNEVHSKKMSNARIQQIVTLLYTHKRIIKSDGVINHQSEVLNETITRMYKHIEYYRNNEMVTTNFGFLKTIVDNWYPIV